MAGPVTQEVYEAYHEAWDKHKGDRIRLDGPSSEPTISTTMLIAIDEDENKALEVAQRGMEGLQRRTFNTHRFDALIIDEEEQEAALAPLKHIQAGLQEAVKFGAGTPPQIAERFAMLLEPELIDRIVLMTPAGDMTMDESRRTLELLEWLGIAVPRWLKNELLDARDILAASLEACEAAWRDVLSYARSNFGNTASAALALVLRAANSSCISAVNPERPSMPDFRFKSVSISSADIFFSRIK